MTNTTNIYYLFICIDIKNPVTHLRIHITFFTINTLKDIENHIILLSHKHPILLFQQRLLDLVFISFTYGSFPVLTECNQEALARLSQVSLKRNGLDRRRHHHTQDDPPTFITQKHSTPPACSFL